MKFKNQKGQAVLIVLLSLSVVLVVVMFVVSRSITDISLSSKEENSMRAFSAAEAGIERLLVSTTGTILNNQTIGDAKFSASVTNFAAGSTSVVYPISLKSGEFATFWFTRPAETSFTGRYIKLCWGDEGTLNNNSKTPAVEFTVYYTTVANDLTTLKVAKATFDPSSRISSNNFTSATSELCTVGGENFQFHTTNNIDLSNGVNGLGIAAWATPGVLQYATVKILYNDTVAHKIGIDISMNSGKILPSQGVKIESAGSFESANRSIDVYQLYPIAPVIFENAIFSPSSIIK